MAIKIEFSCYLIWTIRNIEVEKISHLSDTQLVDGRENFYMMDSSVFYSLRIASRLMY